MSENDAAFRYGNFEVLARPDGAAELLGGGSFGKTYKARHVFLDQIVALKVISEKFAEDKNAKERFLREARVVHGLRHPNIAQVIDFGEANNTLYYAMEYCEGGSLEELVKRTGPLDPTTVLLLAQQLAEALECSHLRGFIHRDVKPANVMLADKSDALVLKLVDFGLVKPLVQDNERMASLTLDGQNFFTPLFASPEQVMEEELDARSDLFSLGMTLWFLLKGSSPETGSTAVIMAKRLSVDSYDAQLPATLPAKLAFVLRKLLEKDKANRFASATDVLGAILSDDPVPAVPTPANQAAITAPEDIGESDPGATLAFEATPPPNRLADHYQIVEKAGRSSLGNTYRAVRMADHTPVSVTVLDDVLREDPERMERLRQAVAQVAPAVHESISQVYGLEEFDDAEVLVREWSGGISLQNVVKSRGSIPFAEAVLPLRLIAAGVDFATAAGLSGIRLAPDEIYLQPADGSLEFPDTAALLTTNLRQWPPFRVRLTPILLEDEAAQDISMTLSAQSIGSPRVEFGSLLYRLVAGMQVKFAARVNRGSYIRTSGLSEEANWILSGCIVDEGVAAEGCVGVVQALQRAEGIGDGDSPSATTMRQPGATTGSSFKTSSATRSKPAGSAGATQSKPAGSPGATQSKPPGSPGATQSRLARPPGATQSPKPLPPPPVTATQSTKLKTTAWRLTDPPVSPPPPPPPAFAPPIPQMAATPPVVPAALPVTPSPPPPYVADYRGTPPPAKPFPLVPVLVGLAVAAVVLGAVAFFLRPKPANDDHDKIALQSPSPTPTVAVSTPTPTATTTATPVATPTPRRATPTPVPPTFVVRNGARLTGASYEIGGQPVRPEHRGSDLVFPLDGLGSAPGDLVVKVPGYKAVRLSVAVGGIMDVPSAMDRETAPVYVAFKSREPDYSFIAFSFGNALPGENVKAASDQTYSLKNISSPAKLELPTGTYEYTLYGAGQQQDTQIAPLKGTVTAKTGGRIEVAVPPTFAGHFRGEFDDDKSHVHVVRTIVLKAGLNEGHVDEQYLVNGKVSPTSVDNVPLAEIRLDADGVLHAHIRYAGHRDPAAHAYDEVFELRHSAAGGLVMTGGREMMPNDPVMRSELEKKLKNTPPMQSNRPGETEMRPVD